MWVALLKLSTLFLFHNQSTEYSNPPRVYHPSSISFQANHILMRTFDLRLVVHIVITLLNIGNMPIGANRGTVITPLQSGHVSKHLKGSDLCRHSI